MVFHRGRDKLQSLRMDVNKRNVHAVLISTRNDSFGEYQKILNFGQIAGADCTRYRLRL